VAGLTPTGRVARLELIGAPGTFAVSGVTARQVLRPPGGGLLRSAAFAVRLARNGSRIETLTISGSGAGHGVGFCQWGAFGRAVAGASHTGILSAYFPGTVVTRLY
jgi:stage II sporulation protein D